MFFKAPIVMRDTWHVWGGSHGATCQKESYSNQSPSDGHVSQSKRRKIQLLGIAHPVVEVHRGTKLIRDLSGGGKADLAFFVFCKNIGRILYSVKNIEL